MIPIDYPSPDGFSIKEENGKAFIFDVVRKRWLRLSPEEWVRQNFLRYLIEVKGYPVSLMAVEKEIALGELRKRCDIVVYQNDVPWMIIECKEMDTPLNEAVAMQVLRYNQALAVAYLVVTNGSYTFGWDVGRMEAMREVPNYEL